MKGKVVSVVLAVWGILQMAKLGLAAGDADWRGDKMRIYVDHNFRGAIAGPSLEPQSLGAGGLHLKIKKKTKTHLSI